MGPSVENGDINCVTPVLPKMQGWVQDTSCRYIYLWIVIRIILATELLCTLLQVELVYISKI
jgi:hypothetical protein